jgi:hypothetical protein
MNPTISFSMRSGIKRLSLAILKNLGISYFVYKSFKSESTFFISFRIISSRQNLNFPGVLLFDLSEFTGLILSIFRL